VKRFRDRIDAGRALALALEEYRRRPDVVVLGLPRGGVPVAAEVADALGAPLDVFVVRKLGVPGQEEFAMGAIATGGIRVLNQATIDMLAIPQAAIERVVEREQRELERREREYRDDRPPPQIAGRIAILVDDGLATGSSMRAAVAALRNLRPARIVVAVPVGAAQTCRMLQAEADEVVCAMVPEDFQAVGLWYDDFGQTSDAEVQAALREAAQ
jgi:putative phosphoribosyl transferase